jgi:hypothetical protein
MNTPHIIAQQHLQINFNGTEADALGFQQALSAWCRDYLPQLLERGFDGCVPTDNRWSLARLELDLGEIALARWEQDLPGLLAKHLADALTALPIAASETPVGDASETIHQHSQKQHLLAACAHFLAHGSLPWQFRMPEGATLASLVQNNKTAFLNKDILALIKPVLHTAAAQTRLVQHFPANFIRQILKAIAPALCQQMDNIHARLATTAQHDSFNQALWHKALALSFSQPDSKASELLIATALALVNSQDDVAPVLAWLSPHWPEVAAELAVLFGGRSSLAASGGQAAHAPVGENPKDEAETLDLSVEKPDANQEARSSLTATIGQAARAPLGESRNDEVETLGLSIENPRANEGLQSSVTATSGQASRAPIGKSLDDEAESQGLSIDNPKTSQEAHSSLLTTSGLAARAPIGESRKDEAGTLGLPLGGSKATEEKDAKVFKNKQPSLSSHPEAQSGLYLDNAGLVLLHPFLPQLFNALAIADGEMLLQAERALGLLHFLATGQTSAPEYELVLPKVLCNVALTEPVAAIAMTADEIEEAEALLMAVVRHWDVLKNTSIDGLRGTFLLRAGKIRQLNDGDWLLQVESKSFDILLEQLPWGFGAVKLPWMPKMLWVEWASQA